MTASDNDVRYRVDSRHGHVESYFFRANHPTERLAVWLKATIFAQPRGTSTAELWCIAFDGAHHRVAAHKATVPFAEARFGAAADGIDVAGAHFDLGVSGATAGSIDDACSWDLRWEQGHTDLGAPLRMLPYDFMYTAPLPKSKFLTPHPVLRVSGTLTAWGETFTVERWLGMQGHNWGREHAAEYAWGQCNFTDGDGEPLCMVEAFSGRIKLGPVTTPLLSGMVVRREGVEYRFDRTLDYWRQDALIDDMSWRLALRGADGEAHLLMDSGPADMACLAYNNPTGSASYCFNSKLARVRLRVNPHNAEGFECHSAHGGALEFLRAQPDSRLPRVV